MTWKHYLVLGGLVILFGAISLLANQYNTEWLDSFASNLSSGFLGSLLTAWLIDRSLAQGRERETSRVRNIALCQLRPVLLRHLTLLVNWYKAAAPHKPVHLPTTISEIFSEDYYHQVRYLDFSKKAPTLYVTDWFAYTTRELESFCTEISRIVDKYATFLSPTALELLENVTHSDLVGMLIQMGKANLPMLDKQHNWNRTYNILNVYDVTNNRSMPMVQGHVEKFESLLRYYNSKAPNLITASDLALWRENIAPSFGSGRLSEAEVND